MKVKPDTIQTLLELKLQIMGGFDIFFSPTNEVPTKLLVLR
ncbi:hypothetical protein V6Z11_1Z098300 [Gossypium hirsutum]